jgi:hypothetical protein
MFACPAARHTLAMLTGPRDLFAILLLPFMVVLTPVWLPRL